MPNPKKSAIFKTEREELITAVHIASRAIGEALDKTPEIFTTYEERTLKNFRMKCYNAVTILECGKSLSKVTDEDFKSKNPESHAHIEGLKAQYKFINNHKNEVAVELLYRIIYNPHAKDWKKKEAERYVKHFIRTGSWKKPDRVNKLTCRYLF